jgi:hypothetical protein
MHVTGEVAEFQRRCCVGWGELQHLLFAHHNHDCAILLEKQNGAIVQPLVARQGDGAFGTGIGLHPQAMPSSILSAENDALDAAVVLEMVKLVEKLRVGRLPKDRIQPEHCALHACVRRRARASFELTLA